MPDLSVCYLHSFIFAHTELAVLLASILLGFERDATTCLTCSCMPHVRYYMSALVKQQATSVTQLVTQPSPPSFLHCGRMSGHTGSSSSCQSRSKGSICLQAAVVSLFIYVHAARCILVAQGGQRPRAPCLTSPGAVLYAPHQLRGQPACSPGPSRASACWGQ